MSNEEPKLHHFEVEHAYTVSKIYEIMATDEDDALERFQDVGTEISSNQDNDVVEIIDGLDADEEDCA